MINAINWKDEYYVSEDRIVLTNDELKIPGIRLFATHNIQNAILPLLPHYHENAFEFTLVVKGSMSFYTGKNEYTVPGGSVFVSFPNETHSTNDTPILKNQQYWVQVDISDPENFLFLQKAAAVKLISDLQDLRQRVIPISSQEICPMIHKAFDLCQKEGNQLQVAAYLLVFLENIITASRTPAANPAQDIETAVNYIKEHIAEDLSLEALASHVDLSTSQFKQKFRHVMGTSPRNYINKEKISEAKKLLLEGFSVTDVAEKLSFNDSSYFSTVFKKYTLKTPRQYVSEHQSSPKDGESTK